MLQKKKEFYIGEVRRQQLEKFKVNIRNSLLSNHNSELEEG